MNSKLAIWIIGGSGVGKTTLAIEIHKIISEITDSKLKSKVVGWGEKEKQFLFTHMTKYSAHVGSLGGTACSGTDTLSTKDRISKSFQEAIHHYPIVVLDGIMATATWFDWLKAEPNVKLFLIHIEISPEENFKRLRNRRAIKQNIKAENVVLQPKTLDNLRGKLKGFANLYRKIAPKSDYHIQIRSDVLSRERTVEIVQKYMIDHILS